MANGNTPSKVRDSRAQTATVTDNNAGLTLSVGQQQFQVPPLTARQAAAARALEGFKAFAGVINSEGEKIWVSGELSKLNHELKVGEQELAGITAPMENIRRDALTAKRNAENAYAEYLNTLRTGVRIIKAEVLRWELLQQQKQLQAERQAQQAAQAEIRRREEEAARVAEAAALKHREEQERARVEAEAGRKAEADRILREAEQQLTEAAARVEDIQDAASMVETHPVVVSESVKVAGQAVTGRWVYEITDIKEVFLGVIDGSTPWDAVRVKVANRIAPIDPYLPKGFPPEPSRPLSEIEALEINLPFFMTEARRRMENMSYRGVKAVFVQDIRVAS